MSARSPRELKLRISVQSYGTASRELGRSGRLMRGRVLRVNGHRTEVWALIFETLHAEPQSVSDTGSTKAQLKWRWPPEMGL